MWFRSPARPACDSSFNSLGCPAQSLYGVSSVHAGDGAPCPALFSTVGERREQVCKVLEMRARETAWATGLYRQRTPEALAAVVGLATLSLRA